MSPNPVQSSTQVQPPAAKEPRRMSFILNRTLDVASSILIIVLASVTAGATACLGA